MYELQKHAEWKKHYTKDTVSFHLYEVLEEKKLICGENLLSVVPHGRGERRRLGLNGKEHEEGFRGWWLDLDRTWVTQLYGICQNSMNLHFTVYKIYFQKKNHK